LVWFLRKSNKEERDWEEIGGRAEGNVYEEESPERRGYGLRKKREISYRESMRKVVFYWKVKKSNDKWGKGQGFNK